VPDLTDHQRALEQFKLASETYRPQRAREIEDLRFDAGDQWPEDIAAMRKGRGDVNSVDYLPPRPILTIRTLDQPIAQIVNQARNARFAAKIAPKADAKQETADVIQGLMRAIEYESHAQTAYIWAFQQAVICGRGYYRINKVWTHDDPNDLSNDPAAWDQDIRIEMILNGFSVYMDPWAQAVNDPKAAEWCLITEDIPEERYKREYKDSALAGYSETDLQGLGDYQDQWVMTGDNGARCYRIAEYWFTVYDTKTEKNPKDPAQTREVTKRTVKWAKMNGVEWLDAPQEWDGKYIPIIPVVGVEKNVAGKRLWEGVVRPNLDPCRMINYTASFDAESMGTVQRAPWIGAAGQFEGFEAQWKANNTRLQPFLEYNAVTDATGADHLPPPQRQVPTYPVSTEQISLYTNFVRSTTGVPDAALGHVNANDKSGKAIAALQQASEQGTSNFPDHLQRAIQHGDLVILDLIPHVYDRPGRVVQILEGDKDARSSVMLNQPFARVQNQLQPMAPGQQPPMVPGPNGQAMPAPVEHIDLTNGAQYAVVVEIGKSFATRKQAGLEGMSNLAQAAPELVPRYADKWVEAMDFPESEEIAARVKPPGVDDGGLPPQVQAAMQQMQQENQQLKMMVATKQLETQATLEKAQMDNQARVQVAQIGAQTQLVVAEVKAQSTELAQRIAILETMIGVEKEQRLQAQAHVHEHSLQAHTQAHEAGLTAQEHAHALEQAAQAHQQGLEAADQGHQQALEQQAAQPEPAAAGA
jgi:hypothetical protein